MRNRPFYHKLYADMIREKYPEKEIFCSFFLKKQNWIALDVIQINDLLFGMDKDKSDIRVDKKHRAYDKESIKQILRYQKDNKLSNTQVANMHGLSKNTIAKWKQLFPSLCV